MSEACIICNVEARAALSDGARQFIEEFVKDRPPDYIERGLQAQGILPDWPEESAGWLKCWNCRGTGITNNPDPAVGLEGR